MERPARALGGSAVVVAAVAVLAVTAFALWQPEEPSPSAATQPRPVASGEAEPGSPGDPGATDPTPGASTPTGPDLLLPNMRSLDAGELQIEVNGDVRLLRFSASLANVGAGPLLVHPIRRPPHCDPGQRGARQLLYADRNGDDRFQRGRARVERRRFAGCMLDHPQHEHWHFDAMAAYSLHRPGTERVIVSTDKVSFCLRDNEKVPGLGQAVPRRYFGDCTRNGPQGISPGWVDIYPFDLPGQSLTLPASVRAETLCLVLEADPLSRLVETDETDNATAIGIRIEGTSVRRVNDAGCRP